MRRKILWISQAILAIVLIIFAFLSTQVFYKDRVKDAQSDLKTYMSFFEESAYSWDSAGAKAFSEKLDFLRVTFLDSEGNVVGDSVKEGLGNHAGREEVISALRTGEGYAVRKSNSLGEDMIYYCRKTVLDGGSTRLIRLSMSVESVWRMFAGSLPTLGIFLLIDFFICLLFTYLETEYIISPVERLAKEAALNLKLSTKYPELKPIVDILNKRNEEVATRLDELTREKELVEKAQRSKNDFIANITHEMNTPLTSIRGYSELLASGVLDGEQAKAAANTILSQSDRLSKLIARIINYNAIDNDELPAYEVDLSALANETLELLLPDIEKRGLKLEKNIEAGITVMSRHERLSEVMGNLIRNAIRYNKEGGRLAVRVTRTEKGVARFSVLDEGQGIAEENQERVFDRFFTVDKSHGGKGGGFGLGLAIVKKICNKSGWIIGLESKLGEGTIFTVDFI
ncbi:MAG: hypothetical protein IJY62_00320 [Clostridia bacterium]|nr:hypothetical protein [Clostridia bacterium]